MVGAFTYIRIADYEFCRINIHRFRICQKKQSDDKPGYVSRSTTQKGPLTAFRHLSELDVTTTTLAAYPPTMDEQSLNVGILGLATHKTCGMPHCCDTRWALTPPFHPYQNRRLFSVTLLHSHPRLPVKKYGALCCPDFPHTDKFGERRNARLHYANLVNFSQS